MLLSFTANAQEATDSVAVAFNDSLFQTLPELLVTGNKPVVKVEGAKLVFDVNQLTKNKPVDNAFDALKHLPGVTPQGDDINLGGMSVALMINGKLTSMSREQVITLLKSMPANRVKIAEVMYAAPARYQVRGALINVTLAKEVSKDASLQGELYAKAESKHEANFNERASLAFHKGIVSIDGYYSLTHGKLFHTNDKTGIHTLDNGDFYPTLSTTYIPSSGHMWQLSFSTEKKYPEFWAVQNVTSYFGGQYEHIVGNPALKPSKEYSLSLVHVLHNKYMFRGWFSHTKDYFTQTMFQARDQLVEIDKFDNFDFYQNAGIMISSPWKPAWWLDSRATVFGEWMRVKDSDYYDCPFDRNIAYAMLSANATIRFVRSHDLSLTINGFARTKSYQGPLDLPASGNLNLSLRYAFLSGNAILTLYCNDLFQTMMITPKNHWAGQNLRCKYSCFRTVGLSFTYRFGGYKAKNHEAVDTSRMKK